MMKTNFSTAGLLLGLILGPIAEDGMRDLLIISHNSPVTYILTRPIAMALVLSIAFIVYISFKPQPWQEK
jgi:putative tricarboxylic transport membrane protein